MLQRLGVLVASFAFSFADLTAQSRPARKPAVTEVIFIGANHAYAFLQPDFSPAHIRALLSKVSPAAVCVENPADWPSNEGIPTYPHEQYAAITWAATSGTSIHHVNWDNEGYLRQIQTTLRMAPTAIPSASARGFPAFRDGYLARGAFSASLVYGEAEGINSLERYHRTRFDQPPDEPEGDATARMRDDSIAVRIQKVIAANRGRRIAVVYGAGHFLPLKRRLERDPGVRVMLPLSYFPLTPREVSRGWHEDDARVLLGAQLDDWRVIASPQLRDHVKTKALLDRLRLAAPNSAASRYFDARWRMLMGELDSARVLLEQVVANPGRDSVDYRADPRWSWPPFLTYGDKARFNLAVVHDLSGNRQRALEQYRALLSSPDSTLLVPMGKWARIDLKPFLESFLAQPFQGGLVEGYRAELAMGRAK